jgi:hypothetical protein
MEAGDHLSHTGTTDDDDSDYEPETQTQQQPTNQTSDRPPAPRSRAERQQQRWAARAQQQSEDERELQQRRQQREQQRARGARSRAQQQQRPTTSAPAAAAGQPCCGCEQCDEQQQHCAECTQVPATSAPPLRWWTLARWGDAIDDVAAALPHMLRRLDAQSLPTRVLPRRVALGAAAPLLPGMELSRVLAAYDARVQRLYSMRAPYEHEYVHGPASHEHEHEQEYVGCSPTECGSGGGVARDHGRYDNVGCSPEYVPGCSRGMSNVPGCSQGMSNVLGCSRGMSDVPGCSQGMSVSGQHDCLS